MKLVIDTWKSGCLQKFSQLWCSIYLKFYLRFHYLVLQQLLMDTESSTNSYLNDALFCYINCYLSYALIKVYISIFFFLFLPWNRQITSKSIIGIWTMKFIINVSFPAVVHHFSALACLLLNERQANKPKDAIHKNFWVNRKIKKKKGKNLLKLSSIIDKGT